MSKAQTVSTTAIDPTVAAGAAQFLSPSYSASRL